MIKLFYVVYLLITISISTVHAAGECPHKSRAGEPLPDSQCCPLELNETVGSACMNEQRLLDVILNNFKPSKIWWYQNDSILRGPQAFKRKDDGAPTDIIFNDVFVKQSKVVDHYLIKKQNGKYMMFRDRTSDKVANVDAFLPTDDDIPLTIDSKGRPSFTLQFVDSVTGNLLPLWTLQHYDDRAIFIEDGIEVREYPFLGEHEYQ